MTLTTHRGIKLWMLVSSTPRIALLLTLSALSLTACGQPGQQRKSIAMENAQTALQSSQSETIETPEEEAENRALLDQSPEREMSREEFIEYNEKIRESMRATPAATTPSVPPAEQTPLKDTRPSPPHFPTETLLSPPKPEQANIPFVPTKKTDSLLTTDEPAPPKSKPTQKPLPTIEQPATPPFAAESTKPAPRNPWWTVKPSPSAPLNPTPVLKPTPPKKFPTKLAPVNPPAKKTEPAKPIPTWPKFPPTPAPVKVPAPAPAEVDDGVDVEDELASANYAGPKTVIERPRSTSKFMLSETAAELALMSGAKYQTLQVDIVGKPTRACNYFVITALAEAKVVGPKSLPFFTAGSFDNKYLTVKNGWARISLVELKQWFKEGRSFDVIFQKDPPAGKSYGHISIPIGLNAKGDVMVAEASLNKVANRVRVYTDRDASNYRVFVRY